MFRTVTLLSVSVVVVLVIGRRLISGKKRAVGRGNSAGRFPLLERLCALGACAASVVLAVTGFAPALVGRALTGYALLAHTALGGLLAAAFAGLLVLRGRSYGPDEVGGESRFSTGAKLGFWLTAASTLTLILSVLAAMVPILGTHGQHAAIEIHRYAALVFLLSSIAYVGSLRRNG